MTYLDIYNAAKGSPDLRLRLIVACAVWAASIAKLADDAAGRAKKVALAQTIVVDPEPPAARLTWFVTLHFATQGKAEFTDAELQPVVNALLDDYATQRISS